MEIAQFAPAATLLPHVLLSIEKSPRLAPLIEIPEIVSGISPVLVSVATCGMEVVPGSRAANVSDEVDNEAPANPTFAEMERSVVNWLKGSTTKKKPESEPNIDGLKVIMTWQGVVAHVPVERV